MKPAGTCATCRAWLKSPTELGQGQCCNNPPQMIPVARGLQPVFPITTGENWCWQWQGSDQGEAQGQGQGGGQVEDQAPGRILQG